MLLEKDMDKFYKWIESSKKHEIPEIDSFIGGIEKDIESVKNAVIYEYSNGLAEGSVNKLKVIKRIMYGRCSFEPLKIKTLKLEVNRIIN